MPLLQARALGLFSCRYRQSTGAALWITMLTTQRRLERRFRSEDGSRPPTRAEAMSMGWGFGALVWYCQQAEEPGEYAVAVLKALLWLAFLIYEAFKALHRLTTEAGSGAE